MSNTWPNADSGFKLAEIQARIPKVSERLGQVEAALDAATVSDDLGEIDLQEADIAEQELSLELLRTKRADLKVRLARVQQLKKAEGILSEIIMTYDAMTEAQQEIPKLEQHMAELERREREELPGLEQRNADLVELSRSFSTLERMSNDLLTAVNTIKELEKELQQYQEVQDNSSELDTQIMGIQTLVEQTRQALHELEEQRRVGRPQLEARLGRLHELIEKLAALHRGEEQYAQRFKHQFLAEENKIQLEKARKDLREAEQELILAEAEAQQDQQHVDELEHRWRQLSIHRQLQAWQRLKGLSDELSDAQQRLDATEQHQAQLHENYDKAKQAEHIWLLIAIGAAVLGMVLGVAALFLFLIAHQMIIGSILGILAIVTFAGAGLSFQNHSTIHKEEELADQQLHDSAHEVSMLLADRETARHLFDESGSLAPIEHEIQSLGGTIPATRDEAEHQSATGTG